MALDGERSSICYLPPRLMMGLHCLSWQNDHFFKMVGMGMCPNGPLKVGRPRHRATMAHQQCSCLDAGDGSLRQMSTSFAGSAEFLVLVQANAFHVPLEQARTTPTFHACILHISCPVFTPSALLAPYTFMVCTWQGSKAA